MTSLSDPMVVIAETPLRREANDWLLVLEAASIRSHLEHLEIGYRIRVDVADLERAVHALEAFERESAPRPALTAPRLAYGPTWVGFGLAIVLWLGFVAVPPEAPFVDAGIANSRAILRGELWRAVTALTLHADAAHALANTASCALFVTLLMRGVGPGLGLALFVTSGALANLSNAWLHGPGHLSLGASSGIFGVIGCLSGLQFAERWRFRMRRQGAWFPLAAGLGLLAMLGTGGVRTDVLAHVFGLAWGIPLGALTGMSLARVPGGASQLVWAVVAVLAVVGSWVVALA